MNLSDVVLVFIIGTLLFTVFATSLIIFLIYYKRRQQLFLKEKITLEHQFQSQLLQTRLEVQEQSFQYFSEEIHDNVGQQLTICKLLLHQLQEYCSDKGEVLRQQTAEALSRAIADLRNISHTLNGNFIGKKGIKETLEQELKYIASARKIKALLEVEGEPQDLGSERELLIFRIIQEAITNALKHSAPGEIRICLFYQPDFFTVTIKDNGKGFNTNDPCSNGLGLHNMKLRASLLNGNIDIRSTEYEGTVITLNIQLHEKDNRSIS